MKINLDPEMEAIIQAKVESGLYVSRSEVVREALRLMIRHDALKGWREGAARGQAEQNSVDGETITVTPEYQAAIDLDPDRSELDRRGDAAGTDAPR